MNPFLVYLILGPIENVCQLGPRTQGVVSTNPPGKNIFQVGEEVEITCSNMYWLIAEKQKSRKIECKSNGKWESTPVCYGKITNKEKMTVKILLAALL